jgi:hypothetical protein
MECNLEFLLHPGAQRLLALSLLFWEARSGEDNAWAFANGLDALPTQVRNPLPIQQRKKIDCDLTEKKKHYWLYPRDDGSLV